MSATDHFSQDATGLPESSPTQIVDVAPGGAFELRIAAVAKRIGGANVRMLAYNGSVPGPTLRVAEGSQIEVDVVNEGDLEATVHWHGLRLDNRSDGTHETQAPIPIGGRYSCAVAFPDAGLYWYHPHIREDYGQEMGLYGNVIVDPADPDYWAPVNREWVLTLDDVLIEDGQIASFSRSETSYSAMGRFGNVLLVAGEPELALEAHQGEVVRLYLTNTANTRVFKVKLPGARMKLVGGDSGRCEREEIVEEAILAPSERVILDVLLERSGELALEHHTPEKVYRLASIAVERGVGRAFADRGVRAAAHGPGAHRRAGGARSPPLCRARQDARVRRRDGLRRARRRRRGLHLSHAPRGRLGGAGPLPELRHEAPADDPDVHVPHAPRSGLRRAGALPELRHEAAARSHRAGRGSPRPRAR